MRSARSAAPSAPSVSARSPLVLACGVASALLGASACGSSRLDLGSNPASDCVAGTYEGTYSCPTLTGLTAPDLTLTLILTAAPTSDGSPPRTLTLAAGSGASGSTAIASTSNAFSGTVDCATHVLVGTISGAKGSIGDFSGGIDRTGPISARYVTTPGPPHFTGGLASLDADAEASAECTWAATLR